MASSFHRLYHPEIFQGNLTSGGYFEGWYVKLVDSNETLPTAVILGVSLEKRREHSHSFIQFIDGAHGRTEYVRYPLDAFRADRRRFSVRLGETLLDRERITLAVIEENLSLSGTIRFTEIVPYPSSLFAPNVMGWYSFVPFMQCKHAVVSMSNSLSGSLFVDGLEHRLDNGRGYIEKDYGTGFPRAYVWMQSNNFTKRHRSFMLSVATIPWLGGWFTGFLGALWDRGRIIPFATHTGAKITRFQQDGDTLCAVISSRRFEIEIKAERRGGFPLKSPAHGAMTGTITESLTSRITVNMFEKRGKKKELLFTDTGTSAGLEMMDDEGELFSDTAG